MAIENKKTDDNDDIACASFALSFGQNAENIQCSYKVKMRLTVQLKCARILFDNDNFIQFYWRSWVICFSVDFTFLRERVNGHRIDTFIACNWNSDNALCNRIGLIFESSIYLHNFKMNENRLRMFETTGNLFMLKQTTHFLLQLFNTCTLSCRWCYLKISEPTATSLIVTAKTRTVVQRRGHNVRSQQPLHRICMNRMNHKTAKDPHCNGCVNFNQCNIYSWQFFSIILSRKKKRKRQAYNCLSQSLQMGDGTAELARKCMLVFFFLL